MANAKRRVKIAVRDDSVVWTLVRFKDDSVISEPLKLHRLEDEESGNDGVSARLEEGDWSLAPYQDGQKYLAKIIRTSDNKDVILKERQILVLSAGKKTEDQNEKENTEVKLTEKRKEREKKQDQNEQENTEMVMTKNGKGRKRKQASQSNDHKDKDGDKLLKTSAKQKKDILEEKKKKTGEQDSNNGACSKLHIKTYSKQDSSSNPAVSEELIEHYTPSRGIQVEHSNYKFIPLAETIPESYERLVEGSEVAIPRTWFCSLLGKCKGKGPGFTVKKLLDGFFKPEQLASQTSLQLVKENEVAKAIRMYAINKLKMKDSEFNNAVNSKTQTSKRAIKLERTKIINKNNN